MKTASTVACIVSLLFFASVASADILTPWDNLKRRPETSRTEVVIPDIAPDDAGSFDITGFALSGDVSSDDASVAGK